LRLPTTPTPSSCSAPIKNESPAGYFCAWPALAFWYSIHIAGCPPIQVFAARGADISAFRQVAHLQYSQGSSEYAVRKLTVADATIDLFVGLICYAISVVVAPNIPEFLTKFGETGFARSCSLLDPLFSIGRLRVGEKHRPKQHRNDQNTAHAHFLRRLSSLDRSPGVQRSLTRHPG